MAEENDRESLLAELRKDIEREIQGIRKATSDELIELRTEIKEAIASTSSGDRAEREALRAQLDEVNAWIKARREKEQEEHGPKNTLVTPPIDFAKTVETETETKTETNSVPDSTGSSRGGWRRWW